MGYSYFKYPIISTWLDLSRETSETGSIPSYIGDTSKHFLRVFQLETGKSRATFPTNVMRSYLNSTDYIMSQVGFNLYKESTPMAPYEFGNTKLLLKALRTRQAYSSDLRYATNRVGFVDEKGIRYADNCEGFVPKEKYQLFVRNDMQLKCDGLITNTSKITLISYSADCVLCKLEDPETGAIGVFHAQWRNLVGEGENLPTAKPNIVEEIIYQMGTKFGSKPKNIQAVLFPCISLNTFQVGKEVAKAFSRAELKDCIVEDQELGDYYINLSLATVKLLMRSGVKMENIDVLPYSTDEAYFCSKRLSRKAIAKTDLHLLSTAEFTQKSGIDNIKKQELADINPQNLLIVKKF